MITRLLRWLSSLLCQLNGGHWKVLHTEPQRMALKCVTCGYETTGWEIGKAVR